MAIVPPKSVRNARKYGIKRAGKTKKIAEKVGLPFHVACALLWIESSGGNNVFGHDASIFRGAGEVTKHKYLEYKRQRDLYPTGRRMQGVGPCQLTYWSYQDQADALGGCWRPVCNMEVGFRLLAELKKKHHNWTNAGQAYNGSRVYGERLAKEIQVWHERLY